MATMTIRNIPDETYRAIKVRAALNDRSAEAEVRLILETLVDDRSHGTSLRDDILELGKKLALTDEELALFDRDKSPPRDLDLA